MIKAIFKSFAVGFGFVGFPWIMNEIYNWLQANYGFDVAAIFMASVIISLLVFVGKWMTYDITGKWK